MGDKHLRTEPPKRLSTDDLLRVLSDARRRFVLGQLQTGPITVAELTSALARYEGNSPFRPGIDGNRRTIETSLRHVHLPLLADTGLIAWNHRSDAISLTGNASRMPIIANLDDRHLEVTLFGS